MSKHSLAIQVLENAATNSGFYDGPVLDRAIEETQERLAELRTRKANWERENAAVLATIAHLKEVDE